MVEHPPPPKNDEEHPLLKVESGGGDSGRPAAPIPATGWNVNCSTKRAWTDRWPELFSVCWMSGMLFGIFIVIVYGLGTMGVIRRQPLFLMNCNGTRPASEVHYHYLVEDGIDVPYKKLSEYLSYMTTEYPGLRLNVMFLIGNNYRNYYRRSSLPLYLKLKQTGGTINDLYMFRDFHLKYPNINITIISLPKFMAMTPWRNKWKKIPLSNLMFYLRVFSVWKNGGIGMSLDTFSNQYNTHQIEDPAITAILKQHSNGIKLEEYSYTLQKIDRDEQNEFVSLFYGIVHQILNGTRDFLTTSLTRLGNCTAKVESSIPNQLVRTNRAKREVVKNNDNASGIRMNDTNATVGHANTTNITIVDAPYRNTDHASTINHNNVLVSMFGKRQQLKKNKTDLILNENKESNGNKSELKVLTSDAEVPQVLLLYDFSIFSENLGPSYLSPEMPTNLLPIHSENYYEQEQEVTNTISPPKKNPSYLLSLALDGNFIAATAKQHSFLGHIISTACQRMPPRFAIQDAILTQCPSLLSDGLYCGSIYIL